MGVALRNRNWSRGSERDFQRGSKSTSVSDAIFEGSGGFGDAFREVFGSLHRLRNRILGCFFAILFATAFSDRFFIDFGRPRMLKIAIFLSKINDFCKIDVTGEVTKKA